MKDWIMLGIGCLLVLILLGLYYYRKDHDNYGATARPSFLLAYPYRGGHPVLEYQKMGGFLNPANWGDPIRINEVAGPNYSEGLKTIDNGNLDVDAYGGKEFYGKEPYGCGSCGARENFDYDRENQPVGTPLSWGPNYGAGSLGVPIPAGTLRNTAIPRWQRVTAGKVGLGEPHNLPVRTPPEPNSGSANVTVARTPGYALYEASRPLPGPGPGAQIPYVGSVNSGLPFPEVNTEWQTCGLLTPINHTEVKDSLMNLLCRPIAPGQDLWSYIAQDKNGFIIPLKQTYLEDGDKVHDILGKSGAWRVNLTNINKYIWV